MSGFNCAFTLGKLQSEARLLMHILQGNSCGADLPCGWHGGHCQSICGSGVDLSFNDHQQIDHLATRWPIRSLESQ